MARLSSQAVAVAKEDGAYYTPDAVAAALVQWAVRRDTDTLLDPSCGDGRFLARHANSVGVERDAGAAEVARQRAPGALLHQADFFTWAGQTTHRFDCAVGNPPFIRYQTFKDEVRRRALNLCAELGAPFSALTASWAPFLVVTASLLRAGGRMAFVVPASIGHAPYAAPLIEYLVARFDLVRLVPIRRKLFPHLSEDCWLLFADGFGESTRAIHFAPIQHFGEFRESGPAQVVPVDEWRRDWNRRLRPYLLNRAERALYQDIVREPDSSRLGLAASVGIGYVTGDNEFFHLRPSEAACRGIPDEFLHPTVRNGRVLPARILSPDTIEEWRRADEPMLLLRIPKGATLPPPVEKYLDCEKGQQARETYKCRNRNPWYSVPDVRVPAFFLTYMSGVAPSLVQNAAAATCTNALHAVHPHNGGDGDRLLDVWDSTFVQLSCEPEGHALGGGMLKLEPREAARVVMPSTCVLPNQSSRTSATRFEPFVAGGTMTPRRDDDDTTSRFHRLHAFRHFAEFEGRTQTQAHIRSLHGYVTCRLVLEGEFHPSELTPRPPLRVETAGGRHRLAHDPGAATTAEATLLGGLKTKDVDIVAIKEGIGPVLAVSCKGMTGAVRNLTNRLEETIGECTNIHIAYPNLVFGYLFLIRANRDGDPVAPNDVVLDRDGRPVEGVRRFHQALGAMTGRLGLRNDASRYEAIAMSLVEVSPDRVGELTSDFPPATARSTSISSSGRCTSGTTNDTS